MERRTRLAEPGGRSIFVTLLTAALDANAIGHLGKVLTRRARA